MSYSSPITVTQQCKFCGNPLRIDLYKGCTFGCTYCFAATRQLKGNFGQDNNFDFADINYIKKVFKKLFEDNEEPKNLEEEMLKNKMPLHCGGMSDPFQPIEFEKHLTYQLLELSNKYKVPITFSTKSSYLPEEYWKLLDPEIHSFQVSCVGFDLDFTKKYEVNVDSAKNRVDFLKKLKDKGIFTSLRLQPLIDLQQSTKVLTYALESNAIDYATVEHLKIPLDNKDTRKLFYDLPNLELYINAKSGGRGNQLRLDVRIDNLRKLTELANKYGVKIGAGDNDLHFLTQGRCCCGTDLIPGNYFKNYHKYNLTYFLTSELGEDFKKIEPSYKNTYEMAFLRKGVERKIAVKDYVDKFIKNHPKLIPNERKDLKNYFGIKNNNKLF